MLVERCKTLAPGLLFCGMVALLASYLATGEMFRTHGFSTLTLAIIAGMVIGNVWSTRITVPLNPGVLLSKHQLLRLGIVLYGFRLTLQDIAGVGMAGIVSDLLVLCSTFLLALYVGITLFKLERNSVILIGAGSSICGAAAVMATDGVVDAKSEQVSVAVSTVVVFGSLAIFLYPLLFQLNLDWHFISGSTSGFGIYVGSTIHEVAQVVAAGRSISPTVADVAVITKMVRVMMLAPFLLIVPLLLKAKADVSVSAKKRALSIPWFAFLFIMTAALNSLHLLPMQLVDVLVQLDTVLLAMAMAALGLTTHLSAVRKAGLRPLLLALILFIWLIIGGAMINKFVFWL